MNDDRSPHCVIPPFLHPKRWNLRNFAPFPIWHSSSSIMSSGHFDPGSLQCTNITTIRCLPFDVVSLRHLFPRVRYRMSQLFSECLILSFSIFFFFYINKNRKFNTIILLIYTINFHFFFLSFWHIKEYLIKYRNHNLRDKTHEIKRNRNNYWKSTFFLLIHHWSNNDKTSYTDVYYTHCQLIHSAFLLPITPF